MLIEVKKAIGQISRAVFLYLYLGSILLLAINSPQSTVEFDTTHHEQEYGNPSHCIASYSLFLNAIQAHCSNGPFKIWAKVPRYHLLCLILNIAFKWHIHIDSLPARPGQSQQAWGPSRQVAKSMHSFRLRE